MVKFTISTIGKSGPRVAPTTSSFPIRKADGGIGIRVGIPIRKASVETSPIYVPTYLTRLT